MSNNVNAVVLGSHRVHHIFDGKEVVHTKADGVVKMTKEAFDDATKFGAVRRATAEDRDPSVQAEIAVAGEPPIADSVEMRAAAAAETNAQDSSESNGKSGRRA